MASDNRSVYICLASREVVMWDILTGNKIIDILKDYPEQFPDLYVQKQQKILILKSHKSLYLISKK